MVYYTKNPLTNAITTDVTAAAISPLSKKAISIAPTKPSEAEKTEPVEKNIAGNVIAPSTAYGM